MISKLTGPQRGLTGLDHCCQALPQCLQRGNLGLVLNQASVDARLRLSCDALAPALNGRLKKLFSPQHGLWSEEQANMVESPDSHYKPLGLPVYSLYSDVRRPTAEMLSGLDGLVIDLQDVGTRVYTFVWTMLECLHACAAAGLRVVVLDRPNPLGTEVVEGPVVQPAFRSFVGNAAIPMRHGLTMGELARLLVKEEHIDVELDVIGLPKPASFVSGWNKSEVWVPPSPNMPGLQTVALYPGQVLLEGTNLSEGRGTTSPFEVVGAPFLDGHALAKKLNQRRFPGVAIRPIRFRPVFDKWAQQTCGGIRLHVTDFAAVRSFELTIAILQCVGELAAEHFEWLPPPYEYEEKLPPVDILYGSDRLRTKLNCEMASTLAACDEHMWRQRTVFLRTDACP